MGYIVVSRSPRTNRLIVVTDGAEDSTEDVVAEFATEEEAKERADKVTCCKAWGYEIVEVQ